MSKHSVHLFGLPPRSVWVRCRIVKLVKLTMKRTDWVYLPSFLLVLLPIPIYASFSSPLHCEVSTRMRILLQLKHGVYWQKLDRPGDFTDSNCFETISLTSSHRYGLAALLSSFSFATALRNFQSSSIRLFFIHSCIDTVVSL